MGRSRNLGALGGGKLRTHLIPETDSSFDLGHSDYKIRSLYVSGSTIQLGDSGTISAGAGGIIMPSIVIGTGADKVVLKAAAGGKLEVRDSANASSASAADFATETFVTTSLTSIDSAYVQARQSTGSPGQVAVVKANSVDSGRVLGLIDSAYIQARAQENINAGVGHFLYNATANQTVFSGNDANGNSMTYNGTNVLVMLNGVQVILNTDYTLNASTNTVTFNQGLDSAAQVNVTTFAPASIDNLTDIFDSSYLKSRLTTLYPANAITKEFLYTATSGQTAFTGADSSGSILSYDSSTVEVYANGIRLFKGGDYTANNGTSVVLDDSIGTGSQLVVVDLSSTFGIATDGPLRLSSTSAPTSNTSTGIKGDVVTDASYLYVCTATNTWVRTSIDTTW